MFTSQTSYGFEGTFHPSCALPFSLRITYFTKNIVIHTHLYLMSIAEFTQSKQHIFNEPIGSTFV